MFKLGAIWTMNSAYRLYHSGCPKTAIGMMDRLCRYLVPNPDEEIPFPFTSKEFDSGSKSKKPPVVQQKRKKKNKGRRRNKGRGNRNHHNYGRKGR